MWVNFRDGTIVSLEHHCSRNACIGSMDAARKAGSADAATASISTQSAASTSTSGSNGLTPNSIDYSNPEAAAAPASPITQPIAASFAPDSITSRTMAERCEPSVMRIAISCTREATENAMTE